MTNPLSDSEKHSALRSPLKKGRKILVPEAEPELSESLMDGTSSPLSPKYSKSTLNFVDENTNLPLQSNHTEESELFGLTDTSTISELVSVLCKQAIPTIISFFLSIGGTFINLLFAGHFTHETGDTSAILAGVSMANMFANVSCLSVLIGMSGAVETLGSQHNGAGNYKEVGIILQRSCLILGLLAIPISLLWFFVADIFRALNVQVGETVLEVVQRFIRIRCLTIPMDVFNESYEKYLMSIGVMKPSMWANASFNVSLLLFNLLFVYGFKLNYECLAWSWVISLYLSSFVQFGLSLSYEEVQRTLTPPDRAALTNWKEFISLGLPGTVMLCSEWWAYEVLGIFAALLGSVEVVAQTIIIQTASLAFMIPLGLGIACASLVGNSLGAKKKDLAKRIGKLSVKSIFVVEILVGTIMILCGRFFVDLFTQDPKVIKCANRAIPFLSVFTLVDGLQGVSSGVLRGAGKQFIGAVANIIAFYGIGLPMAWFMCFTLQLGVNGLMLGISCGTVFQVIVLLFLIFIKEDYIYSADVTRRDGFQKLRNIDDEEMGEIVLNELVHVNPLPIRNDDL